MDIDKILKLAELGFNKDDIMKLMGNTSETIPSKDTEKKDSEKPSVEPEKVHDQKKVEENSEVYKQINELSEQIKSLTIQLHKKNINDIVQDAPPVAETAEDILIKALNGLKK